MKALDGLTLVKVHLLTGRTHQIRCHAEYLGYPVLGDKLYGQKDEFFIQAMKGEIEPTFGKYGVINRQLLHASSLSFQHPKNKRMMKFNSSYQVAFAEYKILDDLII